MRPAYRSDSSRWWQTLGDLDVAVLVGAVVLGVWLRRPVPVIVACFGCALAGARRSVCALAVVVGALAVGLSSRAWAAAAPDELGPYTGTACLVSDPAPKNGAVVAVFEIGGERFEAWARGSPRRRLADHLAGECARIDARRRALTGSDGRRAAIRHVVGGLQLTSIDDWDEGSSFARASNRVRRLFARGAMRLPRPDDALFAGLVIGDDRNEPEAMVEQFRASGLSHLTAVSGQNVSFVLAAAAPVLRRLRQWWRWAATLALIGWFVALTRFEPSVLRAGAMAAIGATGFVLGREKPPIRLLLLAIGGLVLVDPMLVWSVGFWLSAGATAGVALLATRLAEALPGPSWLRIPLGVTVAAQAGVAPVSLLVFGSLPLVSLLTNLLAVPVAGLVMLYGLPAALVAGAIGGLGWLGNGLAELLQFPSSVGTRWVEVVAALGARIEPPSPWPAIGWIAVAAVVLVRLLRRDHDR
jgi:competence protein ComEC